MKKRKLKGYVIPTIYLLVLGIMAIGITMLSKNLLDKNIEQDEHYNYTMSVFNEEDETTNNTPPNEETKIEPNVMKPYTNESVSIAKNFYNKEDTTENQQNSLIYYENTYMPNTGILYECDEVFDVIAVMDGKVKDIKTDEILGTVLTLENSQKLTTMYYTLGETKVNVGDTVTMGSVIATSGQSKLQTEKKQTLLFEAYIDGNLTNPNTLFEKNVSELN